MELNKPRLLEKMSRFKCRSESAATHERKEKMYIIFNNENQGLSRAVEHLKDVIQTQVTFTKLPLDQHVYWFNV